MNVLLRNRRVRAAAISAVLGSALLVSAAATRVTATPSSVRVAGFMRFGFDETTPHRMAVDSVLHRGYYVTRVPTSTLWIYDLKRMRAIDRVVSDIPGGPFAVDEVHHRVFFASSQAPANCRDSFIWIFDERAHALTKRGVPCDNTVSGSAFFARGLSYDAPTGKLYVIGESSAVAVGTQVTGLNTYREQTVIRQMTPFEDTFVVDWEVDASSSCDSNTNIPTQPEPVVGRAARGVISYCYVNGQGRAVWIPMDGGAPRKDANGKTVVEVSPTIGRLTAPVIDQRSGRILILEDSPPFGPAVYVYDPEHQRFAGLVPSGIPPRYHGTYYDYMRGFDDVRGRLYLLNRLGLIAADARVDPLRAGVQYPILASGVHNIFSGPIAVDGRLHRLFFAYPSKGGFVVVDDDGPAPASGAVNVERTADVVERAGVTGRTFSGAATAFGMHLLNTGGIPRILDNADEACTAQNDSITPAEGVTIPTSDRDSYGRCPADRAITPGNRESLFATTSLESGEDTGTVAAAAVQRTPSGDVATDHDLREVSRCESDRPQEAGAPAPPEPFPCPSSSPPLADFGNGSRGDDGKGFPFPGASCTDFVGKPSDDDATNSAGRSTVACDERAHTARAQSQAAAVTTTIGDVAVTVARLVSSVTSRLTDAGVETVATSTASGIDLGGEVAIASITTTARTIAHGRTGTARATFSVTFSGVRGPGTSCTSCDPEVVASLVNRVLGASVRARIPAPFVSAGRHGYEGLVQKDPGLAASDRAVNDDDTTTVNGFDLIAYNDSAPTNRDGSAGRSRIVVSFAGVQAGSTYGIYLLPKPGPRAPYRASLVQGRRDRAAPRGRIGVPPAPEYDVVPGSPRVLRVVDSFRFVRTRPREFGMLFALLTFLAFPVYLAVRREVVMGGERP